MHVTINGMLYTLISNDFSMHNLFCHSLFFFILHLYPFQVPLLICSRSLFLFFILPPSKSSLSSTSFFKINGSVLWFTLGHTLHQVCNQFQSLPDESFELPLTCSDPFCCSCHMHLIATNRLSVVMIIGTFCLLAHTWKLHLNCNRPIVLLGSGLETGHPDQGPYNLQLTHTTSYNFAMLKTVKLAHLVTLFSSPVPCSYKNLSFSDGSWIFRLANGCSFFFFQLAGKPFEGLTVDRLAQRTVCALTVEPRRNQHCKWSLESLLILARPISFATKIAQFWARAWMSIKYIVWLDQLSPSCSPVAQTEQPFFHLFLFSFFFWNEPRE